MSTSTAPPRLHQWVDSLSLAQQRELEEMVTCSHRFPPIKDDAAETRLAARAEFLALAGAIKDPDLPSDYATNSDEYSAQAAWQRHQSN